MAAAAILPVKRFSDAKQRLKDDLGAGSRIALASAMFADVLAALERSRVLETIVVVSSEPAIRDITLGRRVTLIEDESERGQSQATLAGLARVAAQGYDSALLVPADCPLMDASELDRLVREATERAFDVAIVPDRHQSGTNALLLDPTGGFKPEFGPNSLSRHTDQARRKGLRWAVKPVPSLAIDLDTTDDLGALTGALRRSHGRAPRTRGVLRQIERSGRLPSVAA